MQLVALLSREGSAEKTAAVAALRCLTTSSRVNTRKCKESEQLFLIFLDRDFNLERSGQLRGAQALWTPYFVTIETRHRLNGANGKAMLASLWRQSFEMIHTLRARSPALASSGAGLCGPEQR